MAVGYALMRRDSTSSPRALTSTTPDAALTSTTSDTSAKNCNVTEISGSDEGVSQAKLLVSESLTLQCEEKSRLAGVTLRSSKQKTLMQIKSTDPGMAAEVAGLAAGEVVLAIDGKPVTNATTIIEACSDAVGRFVVQSLNGKETLVSKDCYGLLGMELLAVAGVKVAKVMNGSLAMRCGLREGDVLLSINGRFCSSVECAKRLLEEADGDRVEVEVRLPRPRITAGWPWQDPTETVLAKRL